jgi:hypothetical protein
VRIRVDGRDLKCVRKGSGRDKIEGGKERDKVISNIKFAAFRFRTWLRKVGCEMPRSSHFRA